MKEQIKRIHAWILSLALGISLFSTVNVTTAQATTTATVTTQAELDTALKNKAVTKITVKNNEDLKLTIEKGTYKAAITLNTQEGRSLSLTIAKGAKISKKIVLNGKGTKTQITSAAKINLTVNSNAVVRLNAGAKGSTVTDNSENTTVLNYTGGTVTVIKSVPKATKSWENVNVGWDEFFGSYLYISDNWSAIPDAVVFIDGEIATGEWYERRLTLDIPLTEGKHVITVEAPGYVKAYSQEITYESQLDGFVLYGPSVWQGEMTLQLIPTLEKEDTLKFFIDDKEITPLESFVNGDNRYIVYLDISNCAKGEHTIKVTVNGYDPYTATFTIE